MAAALRANSERCLRVGGVAAPFWRSGWAWGPVLRWRASVFWACERMERNSGVRSWMEEAMAGSMGAQGRG